ncbi:hypothetical protein ACN2WE_00370 [Streptomyces sp. cg28]|uniref:hypothetical protein n=1 Tax=Streptomyces sp. cg28 TaxID=3403457 RepID=UPI003B218150
MSGQLPGFSVAAEQKTPLGVSDYQGFHRALLALAGDETVAALRALGGAADADFGGVDDGALPACPEMVDDVSERAQPDARSGPVAALPDR